MSQWKDFLFPECYKLQRTYTVYVLLYETNHLNRGTCRKKIFLLAYFGRYSQNKREVNIFYPNEQNTVLEPPPMLVLYLVSSSMSTNRKPPFIPPIKYICCRLRLNYNCNKLNSLLK